MPPISYSSLFPFAIGGLLVFLGELLKPASEDDMKFAFFLSVGKMVMNIAGGTVSSVLARKMLKAVCDALKLQRATPVAEKASYLVALCFMLAVIHAEKKAASFMSLLHVLAAILGIVQGELLRAVFFKGVQEVYFFRVLFYYAVRTIVVALEVFSYKPPQWLIEARKLPRDTSKTNESGKSVAASLTQDTLGNEPRDAERWHADRITIDLSNNELSNLPDEPPMCPKLRSLRLKKNNKLRKIPPAFFTNMPLLQILDLSETGIMSLPKSLFELPLLSELILRKCEFLMMLPPEVGKLKHLEVLDMEGTEIINLPIEIKELSFLRILRVSLYGCLDHDGKSRRQSNEMIPSGVISALSKLEEVRIDVNPDDERWDACVEGLLNEICGLAELRILGFYFPRVELLSRLELDHYASRSKLKLIVGGHSKRIISRLPSNAELELNTRYSYGCLKYINGEGVPEVIKKVLQNATAFHLDRHMTATKLTEFGIQNMDYLEYCVLGECNEMQVIIDGNDVHNHQIVRGSSGAARWFGFDLLEFLYIYYMKNLKSIWEGPVDERCLLRLKSLSLSTCPQLTTIFTAGLLKNLDNLQELTVRDCPAIKSLVSCEEGVKQSVNYLPNLRTISLHYVPELVSISSEVCIAPKLEELSLYNCPKLKSLSIKEVSSEHLKKIAGEKDWWEALEWIQVQCNQFDGIFVPINVDTCF